MTELKSCTEILQQFHRPRKQHKGSPVKARNLQGSSRAKNSDDPRHEVDRNSQKNLDDMRNKLTAFSLKSGLNLANRFSYGKADLLQATLDHDYLPKPFAEY